MCTYPQLDYLTLTSYIGELERGDCVFRQCGNVVATVWHDKKLVYVMSTQTNPVTTTCQRKEKDGTIKTVSIPLCTSRYNKNMGGVDRADQMQGYYQWKMKSRKFYM